MNSARMQLDMYDSPFELQSDDLFSISEFPLIDEDSYEFDLNYPSATVHQTPPSQELFESSEKFVDGSIGEKAKKLYEDGTKIHQKENFMDYVLGLVRREIDVRGLDPVIEDCVSHSSSGKSEFFELNNLLLEKKIQFVRDRHEKTEAQVKAMIEVLEEGQTQLSRAKRVKLGKKIGLSESQIYKWYYDTYKK
jgi:hypothetical protein